MKALKNYSLGILASAFLATACGTPQQTSSLKHDADEPVRIAQGTAWHDEGRDVFLSSIRESFYLEAEFLPKSSALHVRAQFWLDSIDGFLRAKYPEQFTDVPAPQANILNYNQFNAFIHGTVKPNGVRASSAQVTIYTGLIGKVSEAEFISVIAHELGHYYRSHTTPLGENYNYAYVKKENMDPTIPTKVVEGDEFFDKIQTLDTTALALSKAGSDYFKVLLSLDKLKVYYTNDKMEFHPLMAEFLSDKYKKFVSANSSYVLNSSLINAVLTDYFVDGINNTVSLQQKFKSGLNKTTLTKSRIARLRGFFKLSFGQFVDMKEFDVIAVEGTKLGDVSVALSELLPEIKAKPEATVAASERLQKDLIKNGTLANRASISNRLAVTDFLATDLGHFTTEEEADHLAAEFMQNLGINPNSKAELWAKLAQGECEAKLAAKWKTAEGAFIAEAIGRSLEIHHAPCFRAYSVDRDIHAHNYQPASGSWTGLDGVKGFTELNKANSWEDLQAQAALEVQKLD